MFTFLCSVNQPSPLIWVMQQYEIKRLITGSKFLCGEWYKMYGYFNLKLEGVSFLMLCAQAPLSLVIRQYEVEWLGVSSKFINGEKYKLYYDFNFKLDSVLYLMFCRLKLNAPNFVVVALYGATSFLNSVQFLWWS